MSFLENLKKIIDKDFEESLVLNEHSKYLEIKIKKNDILSVIKKLKDEKNLKFNQLIDITAIDYPDRNERFELVYLLLSLSLNIRILIKTSIRDEEMIDSISPLFKSANWHERECYDLFGIKFINHPDLRRIMTDTNFEGHPLRKDFPLTGHTQVRYDSNEKKVISEPVKLSQEYRNFDFSSPWEGISKNLIEKKNKKLD